MKYLIRTSLIILLLFNIFLLYKIEYYKTVLRGNTVQAANYSILKDQLIQNIAYSDIVIDTSLTLMNEKRENIKFGSLVRFGPKLVFRFSETHCSSCIEAEIPRLKALGKLISNENIILLTSFKNFNSLAILKKNYGFTFPIYNMPFNQFNANKIESLNNPYLFVFDKLSSSAKLTFIPDKTQHTVIKGYYSLIANFFNDKNKSSQL